MYASQELMNQKQKKTGKGSLKDIVRMEVPGQALQQAERDGFLAKGVRGLIVSL